MNVLLLDIIKPELQGAGNIHRWELVNNLAKQGCEIFAISITNIDHEKIHIHPLHKKSLIRYFIQLLKLVTNHHFHIIYTRNNLKGIIGIIISKIWMSKFIIEVNGVSQYELGLTQKQSQTVKGVILRMRHNFLLSLEIFVMRRADVVIVVTQGIKDDLINKGVDINKIYVIENGANTALFKPHADKKISNELKNKLHINNNENVIIFVGNLTPWQGVEYLIYAAQQIIEKNKNVKFLIVGDGVIKQNLIELCMELNLVDNFIFTGMVKYEDVPKYISISDIGVVPLAAGRICSPMKLFEYLSSGIPVVASDNETIRNILTNYEGIMVKSEDSTDLAIALTKLLNNEQLRKQMGNNGRKLVMEKYTWSNTAKHLMEVFEKSLTIEK